MSNRTRQRADRPRQNCRNDESCHSLHGSKKLELKAPRTEAPRGAAGRSEERVFASLVEGSSFLVVRSSHWVDQAGLPRCALTLLPRTAEPQDTVELLASVRSTRT